MPMRSILLIGVAVLLAGATAFLARSLLTEEEQAPQQVTAVPEKTGTKVLVAAQTLGIGKILVRPDLEWQSWPNDKTHDRYLLEGQVNPEEFVGHVVRNAMVAGEPVTRANLVSPQERGFLAAALTPGMRAVTVPINSVSGIAGFIFPGDRVDLILNHKVEDAEGNSRRVGETVVRNLRVLAIDTRTSAGGGVEGGPQPQLGKTATFEATPKIAEKIALISDMGTLTMALRSLASNAADETVLQPSDSPPADSATTHTWDAEVSPLLPPINPERDKVLVNLTRGRATAVVEFDKAGGAQETVISDPDAMARVMSSTMGAMTDALAAGLGKAADTAGRTGDNK